MVPIIEWSTGDDIITGVRILEFGVVQTFVLLDIGNGIHGLVVGSGLKVIAMFLDIVLVRVSISGLISVANAPSGRFLINKKPPS